MFALDIIVHPSLSIKEYDWMNVPLIVSFPHFKLFNICISVMLALSSTFILEELEDVANSFKPNAAAIKFIVMNEISKRDLPYWTSGDSGPHLQLQQSSSMVLFSNKKMGNIALAEQGKK